MKLFEYQAKEFFQGASIPIPHGRVIESIEQIEAALDEVGLPCALKSQVMRGGRGKAGLIQFASTKEDARKKAEQLFGSRYSVKKILVEQSLNIAKEIYLCVTVDPPSGKALIMASSQGGVDIEQLAQTSPEKIVKQRVDITCKLLPFQARNVMFDLGLSGDAFKSGAKILSALLNLFRDKDAELVEINPLAVTADGKLVAADAKIIIDDSSVFRQDAMEILPEQFDCDLEYQAAVAGFPYLKFDGDIGLMCAGAGLTNTVYDLINDYGGSVANYLEFGGPNYKRAVEAMEFTLKSNPKVILIVTFGTIARADVMAEGIAGAIEKLKPSVPIVTAIRGTNEEKAGEILRGLGLEPLSDTESAVQKAISLCRGDQS